MTMKTRRFLSRNTENDELINLLKKYLNPERRKQIFEWIETYGYEHTYIDSYTILESAIVYGNSYTLSYICKVIDCDMNTKNKDGKSLLQLAVENKRYDNMRLLIRNGANFDIQTTHGSLLVDIYLDQHIKFRRKNVDKHIIYLITNRKINITVLTLIFMYKLNLVDIEYVDLCISIYNLDVNQRFANNECAIHYVSSYCNISLLKILIKHNAKLNIQCNKYGLSPLFFCGSDNRISDYLISHGANVKLISHSGKYPYMFGNCVLNKSIIIHSIRAGLVENFDIILKPLRNDEEIQREFCFFGKSNGLRLYESCLTNINHDEIDIASRYLTLPFCIREILAFI